MKKVLIPVFVFIREVYAVDKRGKTKGPGRVPHLLDVSVIINTGSGNPGGN